MFAKVVILSALVAVATSDFHSDYALKKWAYKKAVEGCIGQENVERFMIKKRQALAKCSQQQAPELELPIFKKPYKAVDAMVDSAINRPSYSAYNRLRDEEKSDGFIDNAMRKFFLRRMLKRLERLEDDDDEDYERRSDDDRRDEEDLFRIFQTNTRPRYGLGHIFRNRFTRESDESEQGEEQTGSEINALSEKLTEKLEKERVKVEELIGNYTCVLRECEIIDEQNQLNEAGVIKVFESEMNIEDEWLRRNMVKAAKTCIDFAQSLPESVLPELGEGFLSNDLNRLIKFKKCMRKLKLKTCRNFDIKQKLERHFGPLPKMVERTGLKEENLFPFVMKMLHGSHNMEQAEKLF